jgi:hypothetical protein
LGLFIGLVALIWIKGDKLEEPFSSLRTKLPAFMVPAPAATSPSPTSPAPKATSPASGGGETAEPTT